MSQKKISHLENPSQNNIPGQWIFLFHGFGADAYDLRSLSEVLGDNRATHWIFPQGIHQVPIGPGWMGRAWWPLSLRDLDPSQGETDWSEKVPPEMEKLRADVIAWIETFEKDWSKIILGGFSQGAMLATDIFLNAPSSPKGLMVFSGTLICKSQWKTVAPNRKGSKFFQCHGRQDAVLPYSGASRLESFLNAQGLKGSLFSFEGTHEIPMTAIQKANEYLKSLQS